MKMVGVRERQTQTPENSIVVLTEIREAIVKMMTIRPEKLALSVN